MCSDLLLQVDVSERSHLAELVGPKHLAERAGGLLAGEAVDVQLLALVVCACHRVNRLSCRGGGGGGAWVGKGEKRIQEREGEGGVISDSISHPVRTGGATWDLILEI